MNESRYSDETLQDILSRHTNDQAVKKQVRPAFTERKEPTGTQVKEIESIRLEVGRIIMNEAAELAVWLTEQGRRPQVEFIHSSKTKKLFRSPVQHKDIVGEGWIVGSRRQRGKTTVSYAQSPEACEGSVKNLRTSSGYTIARLLSTSGDMYDVGFGGDINVYSMNEFETGEPLDESQIVEFRSNVKTPENAKQAASASLSLWHIDVAKLVDVSSRYLSNRYH